MRLFLEQHLGFLSIVMRVISGVFRGWARGLLQTIERGLRRQEHRRAGRAGHFGRGNRRNADLFDANLQPVEVPLNRTVGDAPRLATRTTGADRQGAEVFYAPQWTQAPRNR